MKKMWEKVISALLALVILVQLAPLPAFAATEGADDGSGVLLSELEESASPATLEGEVEELRTEEGKHFRLTDGSYLSVSYGTPVHYQDEEGRWQDIDNTLTPDARSYHTGDNGGVTASFAKDLSHGQLAAAACGDVSVSMGLLHPTQVQSLPAGQYDRSVTAEVEAEPAVMSLSAGEGWRAEDLVPAALSASVLYREVYPGVDLRYTAHSYDLKEQIILREKQDSYRYDFLLTLDGLTAHLQEDGSVLLNDAQGAAVYRIPAPYMVDAEGNTSNAAEYLLQETAEGTVLSVEADKAWMDGASFPVTIDPTLIAEARRPEMSRSAAIHATYVAQKEPNTTHSNYQDLYLGYGITGGEQWGFFHFRTLPTVPEGSVVTGAALNLFIWVESDSDWGYSSVGCPELPLEMCEVTGTNTDSDNDYYDWLYYMTWNNKPAVDTGHVLDYTLVSADSQGSYVSWDMTRAVKKWYAEGTENRTVAVLPADRGTYSNTHCALAKGIAYSQTYTPIFAVAYRNTTGIEPYYTYNTMGAGHAGSVWLADATGQVKVVKEAASYASTVNPFSVSLVYNSDYFLRRTAAYLPHGSGMSFGSGWTLDCVQKLAAQTIGGTAYLRYTDGDGTEHYFRKGSSRDSTYYYDEDGLGLKIRSVSGGYEMSDDKDNKYLFSGGYLKTITDANGNSVSMTYSGGKLTAVTQKNSGADSITVAALTYTDHRLTAIRDAAGSTMTLSYTDGKLTGIDRDGTALARYAYSGQRLTKLTDAEADYSLSFTYSGGRVSSYTESAGGSSGVRVGVSYPNVSQTVYRDYGTDRTANTGDDLLTSYLFDYAGRTVNAYTTDASGKLLGATNAVYTGSGSTDKKNNRTQRTASMGESGTELLKNSTISGSTGWSMGQGASVVSGVSRDGSGGSIRIKGSWQNKDGNAYQSITVNAPASDTYMLSGWARADAITDTETKASSKELDQFKQFGLRVRIDYSDGTHEWHYVPFCPDLSTWQFVSMALVPRKSGQSGLKVTTIKVLLAYEKNANTAYFDNISLIRETAQTMKYDENGNLVSVTTTGLKAETNTYDKGNLIQSVTGGYGTYSYKYDSKHNLTSVTDGTVTQTMTYSGQGNVTKTTLTGGSLTMTSSAAYDAGGNRLTSVTDSSGATVRYGYGSGVSEMLGLPTSTTDALGTVSSSRYDALGRLTETEVAEQAGVRYTYSKGQLSALRRTAGESQQVYAFAYDAFGNLTALQVGDRTLAGYTYAAGNGNLTRQTYGNGAWVGYGYDSRNRVTQQTDSEGRTRTYAYDPDSHLSSVTDSDGRTIRYVYDGLDRLTDCTVTQDGAQVLHTTQSYNTYGQTTGQSWVLDGTTYAQKYTYDTAKNAIPDGLLTSMTTGAGDTLSFAYDALGRLTGVGGKTSRSYAYADGAGGATTQIAQYSSSFGGKEQVSSSFTYNAAGNITEETTGGRTWRYTYDALGQLTGATDGTTAYTFTYDGAGNLLTASDGSESHTYTYGDADWKDLLTAYDGHAITYDGSGNPTTYYNGREWSFTWTGGRTLSGADSTDGDRETTVAYVYDLDGQRAKKTVTVRKYHTHAYVATETVEPTCVDGYTLETCSCGATKKTVINAKGHRYDRTYYLATCTERGYMLRVCKVCGIELKSNYTAALGHDFVWNSLSKVYKCSRCGEVQPGTDVPNPPKPPISEYDPIETPEEPLVPVEEATADETAVQAEEDRILESEVTTTYSYLYAGGKLLQETVTTGDTTETHNFFYDNTGSPYAMQTGGTTYYYVTNLQGDVVALLDASGSTVASYAYDPYGKILSAEGTMAETNPLRYRGYYYDTETGLYYLQSRYYDPATYRFVNADNAAVIAVSPEKANWDKNLFAYCDNDPVNRKDDEGNIWKWLPFMESGDWGFVHTQVQLHIIGLNGWRGISKEVYTDINTRMDLYSYPTGEVWEVKPYGNGSGQELAAIALENKYVGHYCGGQLIIKGAANAFTGSFSVAYKECTIDVTYWTPASGVVLYDFKTTKKQAQAGAQHETVKPRSGVPFLCVPRARYGSPRTGGGIGGSGLGVCFAAYR